MTGDFSADLSLTFADGGVKAGFPSPAQDYIDRTLDFNRDLIKHPAATFYAKVSGDSMIDAGICDGDIVVIDKSLDAIDGDIIVGYIDNEFTMKYLDLSERHRGIIRLRPGNSKYEPITITPDDEFKVWGVVVHVVKSFR